MAELVIQPDDVSYFDSKNAPHSYSNEFLADVRRTLQNGIVKGVVLSSIGFVLIDDTKLIIVDSRTPAGRGFLDDIEQVRYIIKPNAAALIGGFYLYTPADTAFTTPIDINAWLTIKTLPTITKLSSIYFQIATLDSFYSPAGALSNRYIKLSSTAPITLTAENTDFILPYTSYYNINWNPTFSNNSVKLPWKGMYVARFVLTSNREIQGVGAGPIFHATTFLCKFFLGINGDRGVDDVTFNYVGGDNFVATVILDVVEVNEILKCKVNISSLQALTWNVTSRLNIIFLG